MNEYIVDDNLRQKIHQEFDTIYDKDFKKYSKGKECWEDKWGNYYDGWRPCYLDYDIFLYDNKLIFIFLGDPTGEKFTELCGDVCDRLGYDYRIVGLDMREETNKLDKYIYYNEFFRETTREQVQNKHIPFTQDMIEVLKVSKRKKDFVCFNQNSKLWRIDFLKKIFEEKLWEDGLISAHWEMEGLEDVTPSSVDFKKNRVEYKTTNDDFLIPATEYDIYSDKRFLSKISSNVFYSIIVEAYINEHDRCFTEKTWRFLSNMPFLILGSPNSLHELKKLGFKTFPKMFDERYDKIINNEERMDEIVRQVKNFSKLNHHDKSDKYLNSFDNIIHNQNLFLEKYKKMDDSWFGDVKVLLNEN